MRQLLFLVSLFSCFGLQAQTCVNQALNFDGVNDVVQANTAPITGDGNFTVECRFTCNSTGTANRRLVAFGGTASPNTRFELAESNGALRLVRQVSGGTAAAFVVAASAPNIKDGLWHHIAVTRSGATLKFYLDGVDLNSTLTLSGVLNTNTFRFGQPVLGVTTTTGWVGAIDEVRVWNTVRTLAQISANTNCEVVCSPALPSPVLYYKMNQGANPGGNNPNLLTVTDCLSTAFNGTATGFAMAGATSNWVCGDLAFTNGPCCVADFSSVVSCDSAFFNNTTPTQQPPLTFTWTFGDGQTSTGTSPAHIYSTPGTYTVCLTANNAAGGACSTCKTVTIADNIAPVALCAPPLSVTVVLPFGGGVGVISPAAVNNGSYDNCRIVTTAVSPSTFTCADACSGQPKTVVFTAVDWAGNSSTCSTTIQVVDNTPPTAVCIASVNITLGSTGTATINPGDIDDGSFDNCVIDNITVTPNTFTCADACAGPRTVQLMVTDCSGNTNFCISQVTVQDITAPIFDCPSNITIPLFTNECEVVYPGPDPTVTDNCSAITPIYNFSGASSGSGTGPISGTPFQIGVTDVHYYATDDCGNNDTCVFTIYVIDQTSPIIFNCPANISVSSSTPNGAAVNWTEPSAFDNCGPVNLVTNYQSNSFFPCGTTTVVYSATDNSGNIGTCVFVVTVDCTPNCPNRALDFDGVDDYIQVSPSPVSGNSDFTLEAVITSTATGGSTNCGGTFRRLFGLNGTDTRFEVGECGGALSIYWYNGSSSGPFNFAPNVNIRDGICHHIAITRSGDNVEVFVDGVSVYTSTGIGTLNVSSFRIGQWGGSSDGQQNWQGKVENVRVWNIARTEAEINDFKNCANTGTQTGLMLNYTMDQGVAEGNNATETMATDISGNNADGTLLNFGLNGAVSNWVCGCDGFGGNCGTLLACGDAVVTCSSYLSTSGSIVAAVKKIQNIHNNVPGYDYSGALPAGQMWTLAEMGEVFGLAIDNQVGDIYFTASTAYGKPTGNPIVFGPNGSGGVYRIDGSSLNVDYSFAPVIPNLPGLSDNQAPGLGNICYDQWNNQLLVTNHEDGKIYRIVPGAGGGAILGTPYDHFTDDGIAGFAPLGKRLWGIGVTRNAAGVVEVYYSVWAEDSGRPSSTAYNSIRRVNLFPSGDFDPSTDVEVIQIASAPTYSNPVSDIAFSQTGETMLLAERTMSSDIYPGAHNSRVLRYFRVSGSWILDQPLPLGVNAYPFYGNNSAGGVDFGQYITADSAGIQCDTSIWCTGDYIMMPYGGLTYGLQGFFKDEPSITPSNSWMVDFNGILAEADSKRLVGDVEIYKCPDCPEVTTCDGISANVSRDTSATGCCYNLLIGNQTADYFSNISLNVVSGGVFTGPPTAASGWSLQSFSSNLASFAPNGGGSVPVGGYNLADFCLTSLTADEQVIAVNYYDANFQIVCSDTLTLHCDACAQVAVDSAYCATWGVYKMDFTVRAGDDLPWTLSTAQIVPVTPGVTFTPDLFCPLNLAPGQTSGILTTTVSGAAPGQQVCFTVIVHEQNLCAGEVDIDCCSDLVPVCFIMPECNPCDSTFITASPIGADSCCWDITVHNPRDLFTQIGINVVTPGLEFQSVANPPGSGWFMLSNTPTAILLDAIPPQGTGAYVLNDWHLPNICFNSSNSSSPLAQQVEISWLQDSITCSDTLSFNCASMNDECAYITSYDVNCNVLGSSNPTSYTLTMTVFNASTVTMGFVQLVGVTPAGSVTSGGVNVNIPPGTSSSVTFTLFGNWNSEVCFYLNLHQINDNNQHIHCCVSSNEICVTLPPCALPNEPMAIRAYPNPTKGEISLDFSKALHEEGQLQVFDTFGRLLLSEKVIAGQTSRNLSIRDLPSGVYMLKMREGDQNVWSQRIVRE